MTPYIRSLLGCAPETRRVDDLLTRAWNVLAAWANAESERAYMRGIMTPQQGQARLADASGASKEEE